MLPKVWCDALLFDNSKNGSLGLSGVWYTDCTDLRIGRKKQKKKSVFICVICSLPCPKGFYPTKYQRTVKQIQDFPKVDWWNSGEAASVNP